MNQSGYFPEQNPETRKKQFLDSIRACMEKRSRHLETDVRKTYEEQKTEILKSFQEVFQEGREQIRAMQEAHVKFPVCYIHLSYLLSGALTGESRLKIDFYDRRYFADLQEVDCFWDYRMLFPEYEQELYEMEAQLRQELPRLTACERQKAGIYFQTGNFIVLEPVLKALIAEPEIRACLDGCLAPEVQIFYGAYLDQSERIGGWEL